MEVGSPIWVKFRQLKRQRDSRREQRFSPADGARGHETALWEVATKLEPTPIAPPRPFLREPYSNAMGVVGYLTNGT